MKIIHAVLRWNSIGKTEFTYRPIYRKKKVQDKEVIYAVYNRLRPDTLPTHFELLLQNKATKWGKKYNIEFTYAEDNGYHAIAITDPRDKFSRKVGIKIVKGRINHAQKKLYKELPETVIVPI